MQVPTRGPRVTATDPLRVCPEHYGTFESDEGYRRRGGSVAPAPPADRRGVEPRPLDSASRHRDWRVHPPAASTPRQALALRPRRRPGTRPATIVAQPSRSG